MTRHSKPVQQQFDLRLPPPVGRLIVLEGPDGAGKSTVAKALQKRLEKFEIPSKTLSFPGKKPGTLGDLVYKIHHAPKRFGLRRINSTSLQLMHIAAHLDAIDGEIRPSIEAGTWIILDRYWWSTWAYGLSFGANSQALEAMITLEKDYWQGLRPHLICLLTRPPGARKPSPDPRILTAYQELLERESGDQRAQSIDNSGSLDATLDAIIDCLGVVRKSPIARPPKHPLGPPQGGHERTSAPKRGTPPPPLVSPAKVTPAFDTYWKFAAERQEIFFRRLNGAEGPWTSDPTLQEYKFTNAYRAADRVSQYLIRNVIYRGDGSPEEVFFRTLLFKTFNRIGTWELLTRKLGDISYRDFSFGRYEQVLSQAIERGERIYSAAYIMPTGGPGTSFARKHQLHLNLLETMMKDEVPARISDMRSMRSAFELLKSYPTIGDFLAYQYVTDINYSPIVDFSEREFTVPGPGAKDGIRKCFRDFGGLTESELIRFMADRQEQEFTRLGITFKSLWGRPLQLIDCQNLFCEVDKYSRVAHPEIAGLSGRTRIKQRFQPTGPTVDHWYPPKWGINDKILQGVTNA